MAPTRSPNDSSSNSQDATTRPVSVNDHLAQALRELARGEQTASTLEANLTSLESKLDAILAALGDEELEGDGDLEGKNEVNNNDTNNKASSS
ncbi:hypothetical protein VTJ04DRAFT_951 [Mycothermus thermophilus]|uniref:uncharacterized protein n=1 Tax=Humicola insolens TaxID=85995 RepID=UPI003742675C